MKKTTFEKLFEFLPKSKRKAGVGLAYGLYPFYTSSNNLIKFIDDFDYSGNCLIFGTGGSPSVHYQAGKFSTSTDCIVACPKNNSVVNAKYSYLFFRSNMNILEAGFKGAGLKHISKGYISNIAIPLPLVDDQIRIATVLTRAEKLIAKRKESIMALDELLKSTFLEMFGDPKINPKYFPLVELQELYIDPKNGTKCGPFGSALKREEFVDNGVPVWNMDNISILGQMVMPFRMWITPEKYRELEAYSVLNGDVIISRAGTVGKMCIARMTDEKSIISTNLIRVRFGNKLLPIYFVSLMNYCKGRVGRLKTGADGAFTHMNTSVLDTLTFPYPPIELQNKFAAIVEKVESIKEKYSVSLTELEKLYGSLSQRVFKGELDLSKVLVEKEDQIRELNGEVKETSSIAGEITVSKIYSEAELIKTIKSLPEDTFSFESLMTTLEKASFEEIPPYGELKEQIYNMLEDTNPLLSQTFDKVRKEIVLRINK